MHHIRHLVHVVIGGIASISQAVDGPPGPWLDHTIENNKDKMMML
jgi:hypothetical protein